jgi:prepilin-type N-terminal cleavage/methylation domain-containing protein
MRSSISKARKRFATAFTLVELIITIAIIAILATIGAVSYNSIVGNANQAADKSAAVQVGKVYQNESAVKRTPADALVLSDAAKADLASITTKYNLSFASAAPSVTTGGCTVTFSNIIGGTNTVACTQGSVVEASGPTCTITPGGSVTPCAVSTYKYTCLRPWRWNRVL